jgi:hypothetical protein
MPWPKDCESVTTSGNFSSTFRPDYIELPIPSLPTPYPASRTPTTTHLPHHTHHATPFRPCTPAPHAIYSRSLDGRLRVVPRRRVVAESQATHLNGMPILSAPVSRLPPRLAQFLMHPRSKIRCCGGSPCRNCQRSQRECDYTPVPEEINRATREKKAQAKAAKVTHFATPSNYSPYFVDTPVFDLPYVNGPMRPSHMSHRRSVSVPSFDSVPWGHAPAAPQLHSPALLESAHWMYAAPPAPLTPSVQPEPTRMFPSVLEQTPLHTAYLQGQIDMATSYASSPSLPAEHPTASWPTPSMQTYLRPPIQLSATSSPVTPMSSTFFSPFPSPSVFQGPTAPVTPALAMNNNPSPTFAPEMATTKMVGLGIGMQDMDLYQNPTFVSEDFFASPRF